jgi:excisionase family DNA binding protein
MSSRTPLRDYHRHHRGIDGQVDAVVVALRLAALQWPCPRLVTSVAADAERPPLFDQWLSPAQAARRLGITTSGVHQAVRRGRLPAQRIGGRLVLDPQDVQHYRARRAA